MDRERIIALLEALAPCRGAANGGYGMKITYLGTAAAEAIPALFCNCEWCRRAAANGGKDVRTRSQALIDDCLLVDYPPDSYAHMKDHAVDLPHIHSLLVTHTHQDHLYLEDLGLRFSGFCKDIDGELTLYGNDRLRERFAAQYAQDPADTHLEGLLSVRELPPYVAADIEGYRVTPLLASHDKRERCYIYLVEKDGKALLYGNDTGWFPEATWAHLAGRHLDLVSLDCTCMRYKEGTNHMGNEDVFAVKAELERLGCADDGTIFVVTHFSHNGHMLHADLEAVMNPRGILVAYDGCVVTF